MSSQLPEIIHPVLVTFAVRAEARPFQRRLPPPQSNLEVLLTGIGQRNARTTVEPVLSRLQPRLVLACGFAGGLDPALESGTALFEADDAFPLTEALKAAGARPARFHCAERVVTTAKAKRNLRQQTGADAVEMESAVIRQLCALAGIPSATVRVISDPASESLPIDFNRYLDDMDRIRFAKMAGAMLLSPAKFRAIVQFQRQVRVAADNLARILVGVLEQADAGQKVSPPNGP